MSGPLQGVRIVDMTTVLMGPYATQILGDLGADVIKIEPSDGDTVREVGPRRHAGMSGIFLHANRSKRSVVLDLKAPAGREALLRIAADADVLVYNVRPQAMARLNLSYEEVAKVNPRILYVGLYGYGQGGPYAAKSAYDDLIQGAVAIPTLAQLAGSDVPRYAPSAIADRIVGLAAVNAITAGLFHRERSGEGQSIDVPMFETMAQFILGDHMGGLTFEPPIGPSGYTRILNEHRRPYRTRDGYLCVLLYNDKQWRKFLALIGQPDLMDTDPRFCTIVERNKHIHELYRMVAEIMPTRTTAEWTAALEAADMPVMQLHTVDSLMADPHLDAVGFFDVVEHPSEGAIRSMAIPSTWSKSQPRVARQAPRLGEHSAQVLAEAGYSDEQIRALAALGATRLADDAAASH
ncbi:CoA transferase [Cupriavidus taiwanensis]|uniref:Acetyl-CoA C-acyltransferase n=1 Tax=Cupriavidus taiwanensis TaxID=164546 RepID=A0A375IJ68_9BURK|nr:CoA transferase [Cupriavidus taiwanensis]SOZ27005.1 Acetyl-CoA C-acyltransferase [Cupriavidus taiwanensis]SPA36655.1 Acetyl-CoA C-acyltransferase [Cupriavidus taiwanensis]SPK69902.1 Acetyl-CoA C-acyltransferase [Cupriavidus taiwanensis]SPK74766.1 Acetyl-CoA C-acyltransferase [Cupriavidus taiwanensis]